MSYFLVRPVTVETMAEALRETFKTAPNRCPVGSPDFFAENINGLDLWGVRGTYDKEEFAKILIRILNEDQPGDSE